MPGSDTQFDLLGIGIDYARDFDGTRADGLIGLAPAPYGNAELLVDKMKEAGIIDKAIFSIDLRLTTDNSDIYFGGYEQDRIKAGTSIEWVDLENTDYWTVNFTMLKYGDIQGQVLSDELIIIDSGTSLTLLRESIFEEWSDSVIESHDKECGVVEGGLLVCYCDSIDEFSDMKVSLSGKEFYMKTFQYIREFNDEEDSRKVCLFLV